jgi:hypothetical protein
VASIAVAPTAAELTRKLRRLDDKDLSDMTILRVPQSVRVKHAASVRMNLLYDGVDDTFGSIEAGGRHPHLAFTWRL